MMIKSMSMVRGCRMNFRQIMREVSCVEHAFSSLQKRFISYNLKNSRNSLEFKFPNRNLNLNPLLVKLGTLHTFEKCDYSKKFATECTTSEDENSANMKIKKIFRTPKHTLGNISAILVKEKNSADYSISPVYKLNNSLWNCTYKIKWPEEKSFTASCKTKRTASNKCALEVLKYLYENAKIDAKGTLILYTKEDVEKITNKNYETLDLTPEQFDKLKEINELHIKEIFPILTESFENYVERDEDLSEDKREDFSQKKVLNFAKYQCKEPTHLPISDYKERIIDMIDQNQVVVIKGEPGCGKSTRIPQYILEGWARKVSQTGDPCNIVITEPRRIAAISLAERVASERNETVGSMVGYQVRFNSNFQRNSGRILYCTNGILLQQFKANPKLTKYSHVIIDEAHERDINTDLLLNMLRRILPSNPTLKVIIMSATIDTTLFQNYFEKSSLLNIPGFTYPVKSYYLEQIPVKLEKTEKMCGNNESPMVHHKEVVDLLKYLNREKPEGAILCFLPGWEDIRKIRELMPSRSNLQVLCLHSRLQDSEQYKIFQKPGGNIRKIILATNIAESSVTINDIVYVVDTGIHKESMLDVAKGVMCLDNYWVSKSSVEQRKGRAGRVRPGECYHLYTTSKLNKLPQFSTPEILRASLTKVVLDSKAFKENMNALEFFSELPSPPSLESVKLALCELEDLGLINDEEKLTPLGQVVLNFQLEPKLSKTLVNSVIYKCVTPIVDIVSIFSLDTEIFQSGLDMKEKIRRVKTKFAKSSDHLALMRIYEIWDDLYEKGEMAALNRFHDEVLLLPHRMKTLKDLRDLHFNYLYDGLKCKVLPISDDFSDEDELVKAVLLSGVGTFLTLKKWELVKGRLKKSTVYITRSSQKASVTPESVNYKKDSSDSDLLLYINETRSNLRRLTLIRETSSIPPIMALLFSHKDIIMKDANKNEEKCNDEQVLLSLAGSNLKYLVDKRKALVIMQCKLALNNCYDHYVFQLTKGGELNVKLNDLWDRTLKMLSEFFSKI